MSSDRTEKPTPKRLADARKKGQVARSRDLTQAASLAVGAGVLGLTGSMLMTRLSTMLADGLRRPGDWALRRLDIADIAAFATSGVSTVAIIVAPIALAAVIAAVAVQAAQGGFVIASETLQMNWGRLSPANGLKRLAPAVAGIDTIRMVIAIAVVAVLATSMIERYTSAAPALARLRPSDGAAVMWATAMQFLRQTAIGLLAVGGADYLVQRQRLMGTLRMTRQEVKDEARQNEGDPQVKGRIRALQRALGRRRMLSATKKATVVVTNPTHFAVALEYRRSSMAAPRVVAKGQDHMAQRIRQVAREHGVPMVENVTLARALYASADVGDTIPAALFEAVAEVLAYLVRLKQVVL